MSAPDTSVNFLFSGDHEPEHALEPSDNLVGGGVRGLVEVDHTTRNIGLDVARERRRSIGDGCKVVGPGNQAGEVLQQKRPFARIDRRNGAGLRFDDLLVSHCDCWRLYSVSVCVSRSSSLSPQCLFEGRSKKKKANCENESHDLLFCGSGGRCVELRIVGSSRRFFLFHTLKRASQNLPRNFF